MPPPISPYHGSLPPPPPLQVLPLQRLSLESGRGTLFAGQTIHTQSLTHSMYVNLMTRMSMKNLIAERQMVRQHLSRSAWTEVEQQWCRRIGEAVLSQEIVLLQPGLLGLLQTPSPVLQVLIIIGSLSSLL